MANTRRRQINLFEEFLADQSGLHCFQGETALLALPREKVVFC